MSKGAVKREAAVFTLRFLRLGQEVQNTRWCVYQCGRGFHESNKECGGPGEALWGVASLFLSLATDDFHSLFLSLTISLSLSFFHLVCLSPLLSYSLIIQSLHFYLYLSCKGSCFVLLIKHFLLHITGQSGTTPALHWVGECQGVVSGQSSGSNGENNDVNKWTISNTREDFLDLDSQSLTRIIIT